MNPVAWVPLLVASAAQLPPAPVPDPTPAPTPWIIAFMGAVSPHLDPACGVTFKISPDWNVVTEVEGLGKCRIVMRPPAWRERAASNCHSPDYVFLVRVQEIGTSFEDAAGGLGFGWDRLYKHWRALGRGPGQALVISGPGWTGLEGSVTDFYHCDDGRGLGESQRALFWDGGRRIANLNREPGIYEYDFRLVIETFRFAPPTQSKKK
jgi:hypothetical protein